MKLIISLFLIITSLFSFTGCNQVNKNEQQYFWSQSKIEKVFKNSCIDSENWKDKDLADVMEEDRGLQITGFLDTSEYTPIPTAIVVGFCAIGEGGGWGNELFLVGHDSNLEQSDYIITEIFDESIGFTLSAEMIKKEKDGLRLVLEGYSSRSEPKCCRDVVDILELQFDKELPKLNFVTNNSYQIQELEDI